MASKSFVFRLDDVEVREREFTLTKAGKVLTVEPKAFRALLFLLRNPQKVISKEELLRAVWGDIAVADGSLTRCIWLLRRVLEDDINQPRYIQTVATVGYRFIGKVEVSEDGLEDPEAPREPEVQGDLGKKVDNRKRSLAWVLAGGGVLVLCCAAAIWYLHRPLPAPRITGYTQITHDGRKKSLVGSDGSRLFLARTNDTDIYFAMFPFESPSHHESIYQISISGGEGARIPVSVPNANLVDVSADGSSLLVISMSEDEKPANPLWNVRTLGGQGRQLGEAVAASFSPDGSSVAYSTLGGEIWLVRSVGAGAHKLASVHGPATDMAWSPDGKVIRFTMDDRIWEISLSGSGPHEVLPGWRPSSPQCCGRWTPDGKFFMFSYENDPILSGNEIWALDERPGLLRRSPAEPIRLAGGPTRWGIPIPGRDGKRIFAEGQSPRGELSRFDPKTKQFQPFLGGISAQGATFSKDGQYVAYVSFPESILWKANRDGSNPVQLSEPSMWAFLPRWSPDGTQIAFAGISATFGYARIYVVSSEGGSPPKRLTEDSEPRNGENFPYWSPDGHKIAFNFYSAQSDWKGDFRILDLDTRQVTTVPGSVGLNAPRLSPDGRYLSATGENAHLKLFDFKTQQWSEIAQKGPVDSPEWSGDGQYIYFRRVIGDLGIFRISLKGGEAEKIVDLKDWHDAGWYGKYMGLDPTDAPLLLRDIGSDDIYALTLDQK